MFDIIKVNLLLVIIIGLGYIAGGFESTEQKKEAGYIDNIISQSTSYYYHIMQTQYTTKKKITTNLYLECN